MFLELNYENQLSELIQIFKSSRLAACKMQFCEVLVFKICATYLLKYFSNDLETPATGQKHCVFTTDNIAWSSVPRSFTRISAGTMARMMRPFMWRLNLYPKHQF